jgi:hypothetical protein
MNILSVLIVILIISLHSFGIECILKLLQKQFKPVSPIEKQNIENIPELLLLDDESRELSVIFKDLYGVELILGPIIAEQISEQYRIIELDLVEIENKFEPIKIYTIAPIDNASASRTHQKFLYAYKKGNWKAARFYINGIGRWGGLKADWNGEMDKYYDLMLQRMKGEIPEDWDGIYR